MVWREILLASFFIEGPAVAAPAIIGDADDSRCREALELATTAFDSNNPTLLWPIAQPSNPATKIIFRQNQADVRNHQEIDADPSEFAALRQDRLGTIYWGRHLLAGKRLVIVGEPRGSGNWYSTYLLNREVSPKWLVEQMRFDEAVSIDEQKLKAAFGKESRWNPPIILMDARPNPYWLIDRGEIYEPMADWRIYDVTRNGMTTRCRISFGYSEKTLGGLPPVVRKLAAALDEALGTETYEGTYVPVHNLRVEVAKAWAHVSLRPWALTEGPDRPYNTRLEVERGLAVWAKQNRRRTVLLQQIKSTYPVAERALTSYYAARFKGRHGPAPELSRRALDYMFRSYFIFHKEERIAAPGPNLSSSSDKEGGDAREARLSGGAAPWVIVIVGSTILLTALFWLIVRHRTRLKQGGPRRPN